MGYKAVLLALFLKVLHAENKMLTSYEAEAHTPALEDEITEAKIDVSTLERVLGLRSYKTDEDEEYSSLEVDKKEQQQGTTKKPCAIVVLSNSQNPSMQSLLRKYRYDANGILIPSSVQYFIKMLQPGVRSTPVLVPLNDKAFSPMGGFVRYYKEVPPIPQSWAH